MLKVRKDNTCLFWHFLPDSPLYLPLIVLTMSSMKSSLFEGLCRTSKIYHAHVRVQVGKQSTKQPYFTFSSTINTTIPPLKKKKKIILFLWTVRLELLSPSKNKPQNKFSPPRTINKPVAKVKIQHNRVIHNFFATIRLIFQQVEAVWACCFPLSLQETAQQHCRQKKKAGNKTYLIVKVGSVEGSSKGNALLNMQNVLSIL